MPESGAGDRCLSLLQGLGREEILEVLSKGFCNHCEALLVERVRSLIDDKKLAEKLSEVSISDGIKFSADQKKSSEPSVGFPSQSGESVNLERQIRSGTQSSALVNSKPSGPEKKLPSDGLGGISSLPGDNGLSDEQTERLKFAQVGRKKDFVHIERINGERKNVLQGLELHTRVFDSEEQEKIVECVNNLQSMGQKGQLRARTYSEPRKWMRGKGRATIQFGCCYNYATDKDGNPPGIIRDEEVDPLPPLFKQMIKRMVRWHVLPSSCIPNSCIVNIYDEGDCIPPHIDHHDFLRPFCTVSFLTESNILFGGNLKILSPGEFAGPVSIPLPVGSVLVLNGNGADIAKHCVPAVPAKRISITFRKMDESKIPYKYTPDPELMAIRPFVYSPMTKPMVQQNKHESYKVTLSGVEGSARTSKDSFTLGKDDFPPLGSFTSLNKQRGNRNSWK